MKKSRVRTTHFGRLARPGLTASERAMGGVVESVRRLATTKTGDNYNALLTASNERKLANRLAGMRGAAMRMGQLLSMESANILTREFADALAMLRDSADTMPLSRFKRVIRSMVGKPAPRIYPLLRSSDRF